MGRTRQMRFLELIKSEQRLRRNLIIAAAVSVVGAMVGGFLTYWDISHQAPADKLVTIYRTHHCGCVSSWVKNLEAGGLVVRTFEVESLKSERQRLGVPPQLRSCHVANFMGYFVESHVAPAGLKRLAAERPKAKGIVTERTYKARGTTVDDDGRGPIYTIDSEGLPHEWRETDEPSTAPLKQISLALVTKGPGDIE